MDFCYYARRFRYSKYRVFRAGNRQFPGHNISDAENSKVPSRNVRALFISARFSIGAVHNP